MPRPKKDDDDDLDGPTGEELRSSNQPYVQLSFQLPAFYLRVLDGEAELLSQRRSTLLELLVLRKSGGILVERSPSAPKYRLDRRELHELKRYVWHCRPDIKERLDRLRERMGNIPPRSWVILALNEWIGLPAGVGDLGDHPETSVRDDEMPTEVNVRSKAQASVRRKPHVIRRPGK
jgi:hypothetical protein